MYPSSSIHGHCYGSTMKLFPEGRMLNAGSYLLVPFLNVVRILEDEA